MEQHKDKPLFPFTPVPVRPRHDGWTPERQIAFIEALAQCGCVDEACRRVGMSDTSAYELRMRSGGAAFRKAWEAAEDYGLHFVERGAVSRSRHGVPRPIFYKGEQVGEWRHYDERLTMFLLRTRRPERYGRWIEQAPPPPKEEDEWDDPDPAIRLNGGIERIVSDAELRDYVSRYVRPSAGETGNSGGREESGNGGVEQP